MNKGKKSLAVTIILMSCIFLAWSNSVSALTFAVNNFGDAVDATPGNGTCATAGGVCTLRAAIQEANALGGTHTIFVPAGTVTLSIAGQNEDNGATGDLDIACNLTITGSSPAITSINGNAVDTVFDIHTGNVNFYGITVRNGNPFPGNLNAGGILIRAGAALTFTNGIVADNYSPQYASGIYNFGTLTLSNVSFNSNIAQFSGGGIMNNGTLVASNVIFDGNTALQQNGGGLDNSIGASSTLTGVTFRNNNSAGQYGGAISVSGGTVSLTDVEIVGNNAIAAGGGIAIYQGGNVTLDRVNMSGNASAGNGGGIALWGSSTLSINDSTVDGNAAGLTGGGIANGDNSTLTITKSAIINNTSGTDGGGIFNSSTATLTNVTISGNRSDLGATNDSGGGIYNASNGILNMTNVTLANNLAINSQGDGIYNAGTATLLNTLIANNSDQNCAGTGPMSANFSLSSDNTCSFSGSNNQTDTGNPNIGPLANNGGLTLTHALLTGSPAIDAGDPTTFPPTDQRGMLRPQGAGPDIGAYETARASVVPTLNEWGAIILMALTGLGSIYHLKRRKID